MRAASDGGALTAVRLLYPIVPTLCAAGRHSRGLLHERASQGGRTQGMYAGIDFFSPDRHGRRTRKSSFCFCNGDERNNAY